MEWISVKDRLPEQLKCYLIYSFDWDDSTCIPYIAWSFYNSDGKWVDSIDRSFHNYVTHWMPLPEPPTTT